MPHPENGGGASILLLHATATREKAGARERSQKAKKPPETKNNARIWRIS